LEECEIPLIWPMALALVLVALHAGLHTLSLGGAVGCSRRALLTGTLAAVASPPTRAGAADADGSQPLDWALVREDSAPYSQHYSENARQLARHLDYYIDHVDASVGAALRREIVEFSSVYRRDGYTPYGPMPGLPALQTAYGALAAHFTRYQSTPTGFATPLPDALVGTVRRNVADATKALARFDRLVAAQAEPDGERMSVERSI
jgi:hypothetical protein